MKKYLLSIGLLAALPVLGAGTSVSVPSPEVLRAQLAADTGASRVGYKRDEAGTVARTLKQKVGEIVSVRDWATCDGTADDTTGIQAAINALGSGGGTVWVPPGTCRVSSISLGNAITLAGQGRQSILKRVAGTGTNLLTAAGKNKVTITNLTVDGTGATGMPANIYIAGSHDVAVEGIWSINAAGHGISLQSGTDAASHSKSIVRGNVVTGAGLYGIEAKDSSRVQIENNAVSQSGGAGINVYGSTAYAVSNARITGNSVSEAGGNGIEVPFVAGGTAATPGVQDIVISGNAVEASALNGILVQGRFATVAGNSSDNNGTAASHQGIVVNTWTATVTGNTVTRNAGVGIDFGDCARIVAANNVIEQNGIIGLEINSTEDFVVQGNVVVNNNTTAGAGALAAGILVHLGTGGYPFTGDSVNGVIANNVVRSGTNQQYGIKVTDNTGNIQVVSNDAMFAGSVRDFDIATPTGSFTTAGNTTQVPTYTPADTLTIPQVGNLFTVNAGAAQINSIVTDGGTYEIGRIIRLKFNGAATVGNGTGNIYLNSAFTAAAGSTLVLMRADAAGWVEVGRH